MPLQGEPPRLRYRYPAPLLLQVGWSLLLGLRRSFPADATRLSGTITPPPRVEGLQHVPRSGGVVIAFNHYSSRSFPSWWSAIAITAAVASVRPLGPEGSVWLMAGAWTYPDRLRQWAVTPLTAWVFARLARAYGFVVMPPMPPRPQEVEARARAVMRALAIARRVPPPLFGISPEGRDSPDASLVEPPPGAGRFLLLLAASLPVLPVGVHEEGAQLVVRFGAPFALHAPPGLPPAGRDAWASEEVMLAIARQLPPRLWGVYRSRVGGHRQEGITCVASSP